MLQANTCKLLRCRGVAKPAGQGAGSSNHLSCQPSRNHLSPTSPHQNPHQLPSFPPGPAADRRRTRLQVQGSFTEPLISSVWTRLGPSEDIPSFSGLYACCTPFCFAPSAINHTASRRLLRLKWTSSSTTDNFSVTRSRAPSTKTVYKDTELVSCLMRLRHAPLDGVIICAPKCSFWRLSIRRQARCTVESKRS
jgi:hypothetical protein